MLKYFISCSVELNKLGKYPGNGGRAVLLNLGELENFHLNVKCKRFPITRCFLGNCRVSNSNQGETILPALYRRKTPRE
jgi:hypothetical protein